MNPESLEGQLNREEKLEMMPEDLRNEFVGVKDDIRQLHEGTLEGYPKTVRDTPIHQVDVFVIDRRHPVFGRFMGEGDEILKLDEQGYKELMSLQDLLFRERISDEQAEVLFQKFSDYCTMKRSFIQEKKENMVY